MLFVCYHFYMTRLYFIRHADAYNELGVQIEDSPLNNFGKIQSLQLAKRLRYNKFDAMYCSKVRRSIETCEIVNEHHKLKVIYDSHLNEVGSESWPQPGTITRHKDLADFGFQLEKIYKFYKKLFEENLGKEVLIFTHGNWIRVLLSKIVADGNHESFTHFVISNSSLTIIDVEDDGFEHLITVSDAAHTHLYDTRI